MTSLATILILAILITICVIVLKDELRGQIPLASVRNVFLLGFIVFQLFSGIHALNAPFAQGYELGNPGRTGTLFAIYCAIFLTFFLFAYHRFKAVTKVSDKIESRLSVNRLTIANFILLAVVLTVIGFALRMVPIPYVGILTRMTGAACCAMSAAIAGYIWAPRLLQPQIALTASTILLVNLAIVAAEGFGRREEASIMLAFAWGLFHSHFRYVSVRRYLIPVAAVGLAGLMFFSMVTTSRGATRDREMNVAEHFQNLLFNSDPFEGLIDVTSGQNAGLISMWIFEKWPGTWEHTPFRTLKYYVTFPIPRAIWQDKPNTLSAELPYLARMRGVARSLDANEGMTVGPGIIGQARADGGIPMLIIYAMLIGAGIRIVDTLVINRPSRILLILPAGTGLGYLLGTPRGAVAPFLFQYTWQVISSIVLLKIVGYMLFRRYFTPETTSDQPQDPNKIDHKPRTDTETHDDNWAALPPGLAIR